jgi:hypothetical protein
MRRGVVDMRKIAAVLVAFLVMLGCFAAVGCGKQLSEEEKELLEDAIYHEIKRDVSPKAPAEAKESSKEPEEETETEEAKPKKDVEEYYEFVAGQYVREDYNGNQEDLVNKYLELRADGTYGAGLSMTYHEGKYEADPEEGTIVLGDSLYAANEYKVGTDSADLYLTDDDGYRWNRTVIDIDVPGFAF